MSTLYGTALAELGQIFTRLEDAGVDRAVAMIAVARRIVVFGGGREKLQIMGFAKSVNAALDTAPHPWRHARLLVL